MRYLLPSIINESHQDPRTYTRIYREDRRGNALLDLQRMKEIKLTRDYVALVSDHDYERINSRKWFASVGVQIRAARCSLRRMVYMQHEVLGVDSSVLKRQGLEVDHEDRNTLNNQDWNLRILTHAQNMQNSRMAIERVGVCFNYRSNSWICYLDSNGKTRKYLGYRKTKEEALALVAEARNASN